MVKDGTIQSVQPFGDYCGSLSSVRDLGNGAIVPGLINTHTHLEFSDLEQPLGEPGIRFTDWIRLIVKCRNDSHSNVLGTKRSAIQKGLTETISSGVAAVGEIATLPFDIDDYASNRELKQLLFLEQLGSDEKTFLEKRHELDGFLDSPQTLDTNCARHASAHAPYSCHPDLVNQICNQAFSLNRVVAMHLAETREERELLENQTGEFVQLLKDFGVWNPSAFQSRSVLSILNKLSVGRSLVIHGNYLKQHELDFISQQKERMTVVYCPRTHQFFDHEDYPLGQMLERNIRVALGTDSRASNPDLNLFQEMKTISSLFPDLSTTEILQMGTLNGAVAIGLDKQLGTLTPNKSAALSFVAGPSGETHVNDWLFYPSANSSRVH